MHNSQMKRYMGIIWKDRYIYLILLPVLLNFIIFHYLPMYGIQIAFKDYNIAKGVAESPWIGFTHFINFFNSPYFERVIGNTVIIGILSIIIGFPFPIILALSLNEVRNQKYKRFVQSVSYLPHFISAAILVSLIRIILNPDDGVLNQLLYLLGKEKVDFLGHAEYFRTVYLTSVIWQTTGFSSIIYIAAISSINPELYEAANIDGAGRLQKMWHITIAGILPTIVILFILRLGAVLDVSWQQIFLMQNTINVETSEVIQTYVYKRGFGYEGSGGNYGFGTAIGLFQSVIGFILIVVSNKVSKKVSDIYIF